ncbi:MAG: 4-(cytidine 5'-diphospho)-2-C-methyl-D-erythritol kinase [Ruminococcus sp.]|nr:4-(cytidine 5'-diphospho)-2-C-methyl-D-erythritol kinase [Ruminococcus sp.]
MTDKNTRPLYKNLTVRAYGKLNLLLDIVGVRDDGYHMLNTVMQHVSLFDTLHLEVEEGGEEGIELICDKEGFPLDSSNLIWKAAEAFKAHTGISYGGRLRVTVDKQLPSQAGMGGGSADCAAMLKAMNTLYGTLLDEDVLSEIGLKLGADVPFCLQDGTRLCQGVGEIMHSLPSPECWFTVIKPEVSVSTPEAYKAYDRLEAPPRSQLDNFLRALASGNIYSFCIYLFNVLEEAVDLPEVRRARERLRDCGALAALMTGSGSAVFGVFAREEHAMAAAKSLEKEYGYCRVCRPVKEGYGFVSVDR